MNSDNQTDVKTKQDIEAQDVPQVQTSERKAIQDNIGNLPMKGK
ncbi:hypothetical protein [Clostridium akagii]|nr:hypothetical protein [Clostridium akagii]